MSTRYLEYVTPGFNNRFPDHGETVKAREKLNIAALVLRLSQGQVPFQRAMLELGLFPMQRRYFCWLRNCLHWIKSIGR